MSQVDSIKNKIKINFHGNRELHSHKCQNNVLWITLLQWTQMKSWFAICLICSIKCLRRMQRVNEVWITVRWDNYHLRNNIFVKLILLEHEQSPYTWPLSIASSMLELSLNFEDPSWEYDTAISFASGYFSSNLQP